MYFKSALAISFSILISGCASSSNTQSDCKIETISVFAASSLASPLAELETTYEQQNSCQDLVISTGSSTTLATQISQGAKADVFISASETATKNLPNSFTTPAPLLQNTLVIAFLTEEQKITSPSDLKDLRWGRCVDEAPCGGIALKALAANELQDNPATLAQDASSLKLLLTSGEIDAALLYHSDVFSNKQLSEITFENSQSAETTYLVTYFNSNDVESRKAIFNSESATKIFTNYGFKKASS